MASGRARWPPTVAAVFGGLFGVFGLLIGSRPLSDNSFLTHLATGRLIAQDGIPRADPYSFTAPGTEWVVQSWLVSGVFGISERFFGTEAVHVLVMVATCVLGVLVWTLTQRAGGLVARVAIAGLAVGVGTATWSERPLLMGLIGMCLVLLACEGRLDPRWLVPVMWIWVNSHGSFPLALVAAGCFAVGSRLDGEVPPRRELSVLAWTAVGIVAGAIGPLGPRVLLFPVDLLSRSEALENVIEWTSPSFSAGWARIFLLQVIVAALLLVRRPSFRAAVPMVVFLAAALVASRNVAVASLVLLPGMAVGLAGLGRLTGQRRSPAMAVGVAAIVAVGGFLALDAVQAQTVELRRYPVHAIVWAQEEGIGPGEQRVATQDLVGNYLTAAYGTEAHVFFDDRFDMYPTELSQDYMELLGGRPGWEQVLDEHEIDVVIWSTERPLAGLLRASPGWSIAYLDPGWLVACRRGSEVCAPA